MTRALENDVPPELLDVAREAFRLGVPYVDLGFESMGSEFVGPIGWELHVRTSSVARDGVVAYLTLDAQRGSEPSAYIPKGDHPSDAEHWDARRVIDWLSEPVPADPDRVHDPGWTPVTDPRVQEQLLADWPTFETGVRSGWTMTREVRWDSAELEQRLLGKAAAPPVFLRWDVVNAYYNAAGHPQSAANGGALECGGWSMTTLGEPRKVYWRSTRHAPYYETMPFPEFEELIGANPPWFVRVASYDDEQERWISPEESRDWNTDESEPA